MKREEDRAEKERLEKEALDRQNEDRGERKMTEADKDQIESALNLSEV